MESPQTEKERDGKSNPELVGPRKAIGSQATSFPTKGTGASRDNKLTSVEGKGEGWNNGLSQRPESSLGVSTKKKKCRA